MYFEPLSITYLLNTWLRLMYQAALCFAVQGLYNFVCDTWIISVNKEHESHTNPFTCESPTVSEKGWGWVNGREESVCQSKRAYTRGIVAPPTLWRHSYGYLQAGLHAGPLLFPSTSWQDIYRLAQVMNSEGILLTSTWGCLLQKQPTGQDQLLGNVPYGRSWNWWIMQAWHQSHRVTSI